MHSTPDQTQVHHARAFLITCTDFRLIDDLMIFMDGNGYRNNYDQFMLAGGSACCAFQSTATDSWKKTLLQHMGIGSDLHHFNEVILIDHRDCGAFKGFAHQQGQRVTLQNEFQIHQQYLQLTKNFIENQFPRDKYLSFKAYLMDLQGKCQSVPLKDQVFSEKNIPSLLVSHLIRDDKFLSSMNLYDTGFFQPKPKMNYLLPTQKQRDAKFAKAIVVSCMDFRLVDDVTHFLDNLGYNNNYDQFVLAGASLGAIQTGDFKHWSQALLDHVYMGQKQYEDANRHREIIFFDHKNCGAFKFFKPKVNFENKMTELIVHEQCMRDAKKLINAHFPNYSFKGYIISLEGIVWRFNLFDHQSGNVSLVSPSQEGKVFANMNLVGGYDQL